jgi:transcriptional regulatory protein RtcR
MQRRRTVVVGFLGTTLDYGGKRRWERWRPTVDLCRHDDLLVSRLELLVPRGADALADEVSADIAAISPETVVRRTPFLVDDAWDFAAVYDGLATFADGLTLDEDGEELLVHVTTGTHVAQICLFLLTESRRLPGRLLQTQPPPRALRGGVDDGGGAPPGRLHVIDLDLSRYDALARRQRREQRHDVDLLKAGIPTKNAKWNALMQELLTVAQRSPAPILLDGPTGAGKTQLARRIYELKKRHKQLTGPFVEVNCATLVGDTAMSTLFGHRRGAFTGAERDRAGLLQGADGGLLFLDEIGELGVDEQAMLLRALEDKRFRPVGGDVEVGSDFQLLAGTNRDLRGLVRQGRFRDDLFARLAVWRFTLPALRERPEDIGPNLDVELERASLRLGVQVRFEATARARFLAFATGPEGLWPGNFRELAATVERLATLADGGRIGVGQVEAECARLRRSWGGSVVGVVGGGVGVDDVGGDDLVVRALGEEGAAALDRFDRVQLDDVLRVCGASASLSAAGRALFARSRAKKASPNDADRLRKYLAGYGLAFATLPRTP